MHRRYYAASGREFRAAFPQPISMEVIIMLLKLGLWIGTPSLITFLASSYSLILENTMFLFMLCLGALLVAIVPQLLDTEH